VCYRTGVLSLLAAYYGVPVLSSALFFVVVVFFCLFFCSSVVGGGGAVRAVTVLRLCYSLF
jgi:hypothetical protein